jgi:hypothetical protein
MIQIHASGLGQGVTVRIHAKFAEWLDYVNAAAAIVMGSYTGQEAAFVSVEPDVAGRASAWRAGCALKRTRCWVRGSADSRRLLVAADQEVFVLDRESGQEIVRAALDSAISGCVLVPKSGRAVVIAEAEVMVLSLKGQVLLKMAMDPIEKWTVDEGGVNLEMANGGRRRIEPG